MSSYTRVTNSLSSVEAYLSTERLARPITEHAGWSMLRPDVTTCDKCDGVGGDSIMGLWSRLSGHAVSILHMLLLALFTPPHSAAVRGSKRLNKMQLYHVVMSRRPFNRRNDYVTAFPLASHLSRTCSHALLRWTMGCADLLNACRRVTITYWHTNATDSPMFSLDPMLPIYDVQIGLTLMLTFWRIHRDY